MDDIASDIDGYRVSRPSLSAEAEQQLRERLFLQITGLPGTGKSAVLRELAESRLATGPTLVIKSDRMTGASWSTYARALGLTATRLEVVLTEIAAVGSPVLFIDGLDRIEVRHRRIVLDLVHTILNSSALRASWRIVATVRDNNIEPLRTWLPAGLGREGGISTVFVRPFDEEEAQVLARARPALLPLLFGDERVAEIARRPFFAAVLAASLSRPSDGRPVPRSETELISAWWARGGYLAAPSMIARRQRTLTRLAKAGAITLGRRITVDALGAPHSVEAGLMALEHWAFEQLERGRDVDEVIRDVVSGHESVAVLGIAVAIALSARRCSRTILPLVIAQRLWHWDLSRYVNDSSSQTNLIGFTSSGDRRHADAVRDSNAREVRRLEIRSLAQLFVLSSDDDLRATAQKAIQAFPKNLPFDFEEECSEKRTAWLKRTAEIWAELGREENYTAVRTGDGKGVYIQLNNPRVNDPDVIAITEHSAVISEFAKVLNWILDSFEHQCLSDKLPLLEALAMAKRLDHPNLFEQPFETAEYFEAPPALFLA